ncbi:hypothetical protein [Photobacterium minamisatsumaniensis]|uniref:hypothetical protein n=1 Tax=Photobacterium minamisatsumaniensis TaxID=2910233 RepID=UPI003D109EF6
MTILKNVKAWPTHWIQQNDKFPEQTIDAFIESSSGKDIGVAFSGGGTRSACCTVGQLKALHDTGLINRVKYISAVSGGAWASIPYTYVSTQKLEHYFGDIEEPQSLCWDSVTKITPNSMQDCIVNSGILGKLISSGLKGKGDESFANVLGDIFLKPLGLHSPNMSFTYNDQTRGEACEVNSALTAHSFIMARQDAPYLIVNATLLNQDGIEFKKKYHVEYTPYYSGIRREVTDEDAFNADDYFGGGYISSYAYDTIGPYDVKETNNTYEFTVKRSPKKWLDWTSERAFSLSDIMASTGAAPQGVTDALKLSAIGFPEFNHFPISIPQNKTRVAEEYSHSDGGQMENLGIMPLLARKVENIIVFINTKKPFKSGDDVAKAELNISLKNLFISTDNWHKFTQFDDNIVFKDGEAELNRIIQQFNQCVSKVDGECPADQVLFAQSNLVTCNNETYAIKEGHAVSVTWIYNQRSLEWENKLADRDIAKAIAEQSANKDNQYKLDNFPHYKTFMENSSVIKLTKLQTNLLSGLSYWTAKKVITEHLQSDS